MTIPKGERRARLVSQIAAIASFEFQFRFMFVAPIHKH
jgi:hypothetical protein